MEYYLALILIIALFSLQRSWDKIDLSIAVRGEYIEQHYKTNK